MAAPPPDAPQPLYKVLSSDGKEFRVTAMALAQSETLNTMTEAFGYTPENMENEEPIPVQEVNSATLSVVLKWAEHHKGEPIPTSTDGVPKDFVIDAFDRELLCVDNDLLFDVTCAANYLNVKGLLRVCCKLIADMSIGKSPEELRIIYGIPTDEEDEAMAAAERAAAEEMAAEMRAAKEAAAKEAAERDVAAEEDRAEEGDAPIGEAAPVEQAGPVVEAALAGGAAAGQAIERAVDVPEVRAERAAPVEEAAAEGEADPAREAAAGQQAQAVVEEAPRNEAAEEAAGDRAAGDQ